MSGFSSDSNVGMVVVGARTFTSSLGRSNGSGRTEVVCSGHSRFNSHHPVSIVGTGHPVVVLSRPRGVNKSIARGTLGGFGPLFDLGCSTARGARRGLICILSTLSTFGGELIGGVRMGNFRIGGFHKASGCLCLRRVVLSGGGPPVTEVRLRVKCGGDVGHRAQVLNINSGLFCVSRRVRRCGNCAVSRVSPVHKAIAFSGNRIVDTNSIMNSMSRGSVHQVRVERAVLSRFRGRRGLFGGKVGALSLFFVSRITGCHRCSRGNSRILNRCNGVFRRRCVGILGRRLAIFGSTCRGCLEAAYSSVSTVRENCFDVSGGANEDVSDTLGENDRFSSSVSTCSLVLGGGRQLLDFRRPAEFVFSRSTLHRN